MFPFQTLLSSILQEAHGTTREVGGNLSSMLTLAAMIFTPLFGLVADRTRRKALLMAFGSLLIIPVYLIMAYHVDLATPLGIRGALQLNLEFFDIQFQHSGLSDNSHDHEGNRLFMVPAVMWPTVALLVDNSRSAPLMVL
jgi:MFS family permease